MRVEVNDNNEIILKEVFSGVGLVSEDGEHFGISMRDSGFEFNYGGYWYEAKEGRLSLLGPDKNEEDLEEVSLEGINPEDFDLDIVYEKGGFCFYGDYLWRFEGKLWRVCPGEGYNSFPSFQVKTIYTYPSEAFGWKKIEKRN